MVDEITFRSITPIFNFEFEHDDTEFSHSGEFKKVRFYISLKRYKKTKVGFPDELMKYVDEHYRREPISTHAPDHYPHNTDYFLVVDATHPYTDGLKFKKLSHESSIFQNSIIRSLRLHCSKGLLFYQTYHLRSIPHPSGFDSLTYSYPLTHQHLFPDLKSEPSVLRNAEVASCRSVFDILISKQWNDNITFGKVMDLALEYYDISFNLQNIEHSFLILMIIFEALFKKESEKDAGRAAKRISQLLPTMKSERKKIHEEFFSNDPYTFCRLRDYIAHGDPDLDRELVKSKYPILNEYIRESIIRLLLIPDGEIDHMKDYYDEISKYCGEHFKTLPNR